ncbi:hypothetical protein CRG98_008882 [Punica granatum]|uniref:Uncharacterized protein n=1 Tax=Punica granatum TaxID=22663 RepID=A0A2I0KQD9_PUNGR|nr:hypothetical protein CRG98_008882 [Punica granatum]
MKLFLPTLHHTTRPIDGSSTILKVFVRNGGGPASLSPSIGLGKSRVSQFWFAHEEEDEDDGPSQLPLQPPLFVGVTWGDEEDNAWVCSSCFAVLNRPPPSMVSSSYKLPFLRCGGQLGRLSCSVLVDDDDK